MLLIYKSNKNLLKVYFKEMFSSSFSSGIHVNQNLKNCSNYKKVLKNKEFGSIDLVWKNGLRSFLKHEPFVFFPILKNY